MNQPTNPSWAASNRANARALALWTTAWVGATALLAFGPPFIWQYNPAVTLVALLLQVGIGIGMILALRKQVAGLDEMQQKIQLQASASTLAVGLVVAGAYELLEDVRLISFSPEISHMMMIMAVTYVFLVFIGQRSYQ